MHHIINTQHTTLHQTTHIIQHTTPHTTHHTTPHHTTPQLFSDTVRVASRTAARVRLHTATVYSNTVSNCIVHVLKVLYLNVSQCHLYSTCTVQYSTSTVRHQIHMYVRPVLAAEFTELREFHRCSPFYSKCLLAWYVHCHAETCRREVTVHVTARTVQCEGILFVGASKQDVDSKCAERTIFQMQSTCR